MHDSSNSPIQLFAFIDQGISIFSGALYRPQVLCFFEPYTFYEFVSATRVLDQDVFLFFHCFPSPRLPSCFYMVVLKNKPYL